MAGVGIRKVVKRFGEVEVIHGIDLEIRDGEFVVFVGPSGCGKSTLLRMVAGLEGTTGGDIMIGDTRVNDLPPRARDIAMVFQDYALYPHKSVLKTWPSACACARHLRRKSGAASMRSPRSCALTTCSSASRASSPAASASGWPWALHRARSQVFSVRRTALQSRCPVAQ